MTRITQPAAVAIATAVKQVRPEWDHAGILAAIKAEHDKGSSVEDTFVAIARIARRKDVRTPGFLNQPGSHWDDEKGEQVRRRGDHNQPCPDHPQLAHPCPDPSHQGDMTPKQVAAAAAECKRLAAEATAAARERRAHVEEARAAASDTHQRRGGGPHPAERPAAACPTPNHDDQEATA